MLKKIIFNTVIITILVMTGAAIMKANKPRHAILKQTGISSTEEKKSDLAPKEAKYYRVIGE